MTAGRSPGALRLVLAGPIAGQDVLPFLHPDQRDAVPVGYLGAPLMGILIGELLALGHQVCAITFDTQLPTSEGPVRRAGPGFSLVVCPARRRTWRNNGLRPGRILDFFAFERRLIAQEMKAAAPDLVHAHWSYEFALAAIEQPAPHLITCHDAPAVVLRFTRSPYRALRYMMAKLAFRRGRAFTTVSDYMATELAGEIGQPPVVIPNPVAPYVFGLGRERAQPSTRRVAMVCNGWDRRKNPEPALRGFAAWRQTEPRAELHLYGADFGAGERAQAWAQAQGLAAGVHFHGRLPHAQLARQLADVDVLLHTSLEESFGVVIAEAMALGLPVVGGLHSGAVPWVMGADGQGYSACGLLADVRHPDAVARALAEAFGQRYVALSASGRLRAKTQFSAERVAGDYLALYAQTMKRTPAPLRHPREPCQETP